MEFLLKGEETAVFVQEKKMEVIIFRDDDQYTAYCPELDLATAQDNPEEALRDLIEAMREYAGDYMNKKEIYSQSPNRKDHLPLVELIIKAEGSWEIRQMLEVRYGELYLRSVQKSSKKPKIQADKIQEA